MRSLADLIRSRSATDSDLLPLVHTTPALYTQKILQGGSIDPRPCDVFSNEWLSYFFVGRPAYKAIGKDIMYWELPSCIIVDFKNISAKRVYPFDSGAFQKGFVPNYARMHDLSEFAIDNSINSIRKYIGTFFGSPQNYYMSKPVDMNVFMNRHKILPTETSINALISLLSGKRIFKEIDERRSAIEIQLEEKIDLVDGKVLAIVLPDTYLSDKKFIKSIENRNIDVITYTVYPIQNEFFYYAIYDKVFSYYKDVGIM